MPLPAPSIPVYPLAPASSFLMRMTVSKLSSRRPSRSLAVDLEVTGRYPPARFPRYGRTADGRLHGQERDVSKFWKRGNIRICLYGLENQTAIDVDMPLRVMEVLG